MTAAVEQDVLNELKDIMEDEFGAVIEDYLQQGQELLADALEQLAAKDFDTLRRTAHTFKGSCMNIGALELQQHMATLEQAAVSRDAAAASNAAELAVQEMPRVRAALAELLE